MVTIRSLLRAQISNMHFIWKDLIVFCNKLHFRYFKGSEYSRDTEALILKHHTLGKECSKIWSI